MAAILFEFFKLYLSTDGLYHIEKIYIYICNNSADKTHIYTFNSCINTQDNVYQN